MQDPEELDPRLISPIADVFCCYLPKRCRRKMCWGMYSKEKMVGVQHCLMLFNAVSCCFILLRYVEYRSVLVNVFSHFLLFLLILFCIKTFLSLFSFFQNNDKEPTPPAQPQYNGTLNPAFDETTEYEVTRI